MDSAASTEGFEPATQTTRAFLDEVRKGGFSGDLADDLATRVVGATDNSIYQLLPQAIVYPRTREDVVLLLRTATQGAYDALKLRPRVAAAPGRTGSRSRPGSSSTSAVT